MQFEWKNNKHKADPQEVGEELEDIRKTYGGKIQPPLVVERAKSEDSVLHEFFEWDDTHAARLYRHKQARSLLQDIVIITDNGEARRSGYVNVVVRHDGGEAEQYYTTEIDAVSNTVTRTYVLEQALKAARRFQEKYRHLSELSAVMAEIDNVLS